MAEPHHPITPADQEADLFFKFQMKLAHWLYGYWKQGLVGIGIFLFFAFVVGQTSTCIRDRAREGSAALARSQALLPEPSQMAQYGLAPLDDLTDPEHVAQLEAAAKSFEDVARSAPGVSSAEAWLHAGNTWGRLGNDAASLAAFQAAYDAERGGIYTYSAGNRLAMLHRKAGADALAIELYRELATDLDGYLAERALIDLMDYSVRTGANESVQRLAAEFRARFSESPRLEDVQAIETRAGVQGS